MNLEGVATIELTDVNTGEKETIVEKNLVTNALNTILGCNFCATYEKSYFYSQMIPLYKRGLGGILVFNDNIQDDPNIIIPPGHVECIGHAGAEAYAGEDDRRGSFNDSESAIIDDGLKLVWDFATNQSNGTIKCLSLTNKLGGEIGIGQDKYISGGGKSPLYKLDDSFAILSEPQICDENFTWSLECIDKTTIIVKKYASPRKKISLKYDYTKRSLIETYTPIIMDKAGAFGNPLQFAEIQGDFLYIVFYFDGSPSYPCLLKISMSDMSIVETINIDSLNFDVRGFVIANGYLYGYDKSKRGAALKLNLNNTADIKQIDLLTDYSSIGISKIGNYIYCGFEKNGRIICSNDKVLYSNHPDLRGRGYGAYHICDGLFYFTNTTINNTQRECTSVNTLYIATINNLATPVVKTADKTMKITYIVREKTS